jgi:GDP-L-fucose synthase
MVTQRKIYVAGHRGMVGAAIVRCLNNCGHTNIVTRSHAELDLTDQAAVDAFFAEERPEQVYLAAAKVGGIYANNTYPAQFIYENLMIQANVIQAAHANDVQKLLFLGSSCIYPKYAEQPMCEDVLLCGKLEPTNEPYAIAKIAGIKLCESYNRQYGRDYRSVMPTNLYGPGDNYHLANCHVLPAMIRKFHLATLAQRGDLEGILADEVRYGEIPSDIRIMIGLDPDRPISLHSKITPKSMVTLWGTGSPYREFLHVDDMAAASLYVMGLCNTDYEACTKPMQSHINVGFGSDVTIREAAEMVATVVGYCGDIEFDASKPDGAPRKLLDSSRLGMMGWKASISFREGLNQAYNSFLGNLSF